MLRPRARARSPFALTIATIGTAAVLAGALVGAFVVGLSACGGKNDAVLDTTTLHGARLPAPIARPSFTLTDTDGKPYEFNAQTRGFVTFLFFGYTSCPDVCPVQLANIATVLKGMDYDERQRARVVFVTTDPKRDTPAVIRAWLDAFDGSFVGLRGTEAEVDSVQRLVGVAPAIREVPKADGSYAVGHAGQVIVFQADDSARVVYLFGTRQADWLHDLPLLLRAPAPPQTQPHASSPAAPSHQPS